MVVDDEGIAPDPQLIKGKGPDILRRMWERRREGASLADLRRETAVDRSVSDKHLELAAEGGRWVSEYQERGSVSPRRRLFGGIDLPGRSSGPDGHA